MCRAPYTSMVVKLGCILQQAARLSRRVTRHHPSNVRRLSCLPATAVLFVNLVAQHDKRKVLGVSRLRLRKESRTNGCRACCLHLTLPPCQAPLLDLYLKCHMICMQRSTFSSSLSHPHDIFVHNRNQPRHGTCSYRIITPPTPPWHDALHR